MYESTGTRFRNFLEHRPRAVSLTEGLETNDNVVGPGVGTGDSGFWLFDIAEAIMVKAPISPLELSDRALIAGLIPSISDLISIFFDGRTRLGLVELL